jgi:hypothetical protein
VQRTQQRIDPRRRRRPHDEDGEVRLRDAARAVPGHHALMAPDELPEAVALNLAKTKRVELALSRQFPGCIIHALSQSYEGT